MLRHTPSHDTQTIEGHRHNHHDHHTEDLPGDGCDDGDGSSLLLDIGETHMSSADATVTIVTPRDFPVTVVMVVMVVMVVTVVLSC